MRREMAEARVAVPPTGTESDRRWDVLVLNICHL